MDGLKTATFTVEGVVPLLMHNGHLADPIGKWAKELKTHTGKRQKTDETHADIARVEWFGGLYLNSKGEPCIPAANIEAALIAGAKKRKLGVKFKASVQCPEMDYPLIYNGPKDINKLFEKPEFHDRRGVVVSQSRTFRTRPRFNSWSLKFTVQYDAAELNKEEIEEVVEITGRLIGIGDFRPKFGRFEVA